MSIKKYHVENKTAFVKKQAVVGTPETVLATDAIASNTLTWSYEPEIDRDSYLGDQNDRTTAVTISDIIGKGTIEVYGVSLGTLNTALLPANVPHYALWEASGGEVLVNGTTGEVGISNLTSKADPVTYDYRMETRDPTNSGTVKSHVIYDALGTVDLNLEIGKPAKFTFNLEGNSNIPVDSAILAPDYGIQKDNKAAILEASNVITSTLTENVSAATPITLCILDLNASNVLGVELSRFRSSCEDTTESNVASSDLTINVLDSELQATNFAPEPNLSRRFTYVVEYGLGAGKNFRVTFDNLVLLEAPQGDSQNYHTRGLSFGNEGTTTIELL